MSKVWLADTVRGRFRCLGLLGSTGLIAGDSTGMAGTVPRVGPVRCGVSSTLSTDMDSRTGLLVISRARWLVWTADSDDRHGCWWPLAMIPDC